MKKIHPTMKIALGAVRSELRHHGEQPEQVSADDALRVLDDLGRSEPSLLASQWYHAASEKQLTRFHRSWTKWVAENAPSTHGPQASRER